MPFTMCYNLKAMEIIRVDDLCFGYNENELVLDHITFRIEKGSYTTIIGHNGSGKSTLAKLLSGLLEKTSGRIVVCNNELCEEKLCSLRASLGIVFQNPDNQFIGSTVSDDIAFGLENRCIEPSKMDEIILEYASKVKMEHFLDKEPQSLSGGQKQRVAIASILAMKPDIIIFDEATSMLDPKGKQDIKNIMKELHLSGKTIISVTHDIEEVLNSSQTIVLNKGRIEMIDEPLKVFEHAQRLQAINLDIPFVFKVRNLFKESGINLKACATIEELVEELCQLK